MSRTKLRYHLETCFVAAALVSGCDRGPIAPPAVMDGPSLGEPALSIEDGDHNGGNPHFFWLPPMVSGPSYSGVFDGGLAPVIRICEWNGTACGVVIAEYSMSTGPGSETLRVAPSDELYIVNWHTNDFGLDATKTYRIVAEVGGRTLGHVDVDVAVNGSQLKNTDTNEYIPLVNGRTLPIKFRIEEGALGGDVTIDASALTSPFIDLRGPNGPIGFLPAAQPVTLPDPGVYTIADRFGGTPIPFTITATGVVDYDAQFDAVFSGRGTSTLLVTGLAYVIDGTPLSDIFLVQGGVGTFSNSVPLPRVELPGAKDVQGIAGGVVFYELTAQGTITYAPSFEPVVDGANTSTLTLVGFDYTVDASALSAPNFLLGGIGTFPTGTLLQVTGLPGSKNVQDVSGGVMPYQLTPTGLIAYAAQDDVVLDGEGTATLVVLGHEIQIDATLLGAPFTIAGIGAFSSSVPATLRTLAGSKAFISNDLNFTFTVDAAGFVDYAAVHDSRVSGRGTNTLLILN